MTDQHTQEPSEAELSHRYDNFDPIRDVPSPVRVDDTVRITAQPSMEMLSPEMRERANAKIGSAPRTPETVSNAVEAVLREHSQGLRVRLGAGEGATQTQRTMLEQANRTRLLQDEIQRLQASLEETVRFETGYDDNGNPTPRPIYRVRGDARHAATAALAEKQREMRLIAGVQGQRELREAHLADHKQEQDTKRQLSEAKEAERRAKEMESEERINRLAKAKFKSRKSHLG